MQVRSVLEKAGLNPDATVKPAVIAGDKEEREAILNGLAGMLHRLHVALGKEAAAVEKEMKEVVEVVMVVQVEEEEAVRCGRGRPRRRGRRRRDDLEATAAAAVAGGRGACARDSAAICADFEFIHTDV